MEPLSGSLFSIKKCNVNKHISHYRFKHYTCRICLYLNRYRFGHTKERYKEHAKKNNISEAGSHIKV